MSDIVKKIISDPQIIESPTKISLNSPEIETVSILIREGSFFAKDQKIGKYTYKNNSNSVNSSQNKISKPIMITAPFYGKLLKYNQEERELILERCKHESFYYNLCTKCSFDKSKELTEVPTENYQKYSSLHPFLTFSLDKAKKEEMNIVKKYLNAKKLILLLDLDNTILHTCPFQITKDEFIYLKNQYDDYVSLVGIRREFDPMTYDKIVVKFRPHLKEFFQALSDKYEIYTYTHGTKEYASGIIQYINSKMGEDSLSLDRLIARENGIIESKTIKKVFPTTENMVIILDDRVNVWTENDENLINCHPYTFFYDELYNNIKEKFIEKDYDNSLFSIMNILLYVQREFYDYYEKNKDVKSVKDIIREKMQSILKGRSFVCSGIFNKNDDITITPIYNQIKKMGGELYKELEDKENIDFLLVPEYKKTKKLLFFEKNKKIMLQAGYIDLCYMFFFQLDYEDFIINEQKQKIEFFDLIVIFEKNKENIKKFYSSNSETNNSTAISNNTNIEDKRNDANNLTKTEEKKEIQTINKEEKDEKNKNNEG